MAKQIGLKFEEEFRGKCIQVLSQKQKDAIIAALKEMIIANFKKGRAHGKRQD